jgi:hypothetical protein
VGLYEIKSIAVFSIMRLAIYDIQEKFQNRQPANETNSKFKRSLSQKRRLFSVEDDPISITAAFPRVLSSETKRKINLRNPSQKEI